MNFKYKSAIQFLSSSIPLIGTDINYFFQRYITKTLPIKKGEFNYLYGEKIERHYNNFLKYNKTGKSVDQCNYYEFGAGWDLFAPIGFSTLGFHLLSVIDIEKHVQIHEVQNTIRLFEEVFPANRNQGLYQIINKKNFREILYNKFRIDYQAPKDAKDTGFDNETFDFIVSNVTFEHISAEHILPVLNEFYRILAKGGIMSVTIDYQDHYANFDKSISIYNYLRYSEKQWKKYNNPAHYQNRLRHGDYVKAIESAGFEIFHANLLMPDEKQLEQLNSLDIHDYFRKYTEDDLKIRCCEFVIGKPKTK